MTDVFSDKLEAWRAYTDSPWGRIRYAVVAEVLRRETSRLGDGLRILDLGGGDGRDAVPLARAGHDVTILDPSTAWLAEAERRAAAAGVRIHAVAGDLSAVPQWGEFDVVLCHFVLQYRPAGADDLATLARLVRPGGIVSVIAPNPVGMVLRQLVVDGPVAAATELAADTKHAVIFDHDVRKIALVEMEQALGGAGLTVVRRYGARIANDLLTEDDRKHEPDYFDELLRLELALCDQEPFVRIGGMYQLIASKA